MPPPLPMQQQAQQRKLKRRGTFTAVTSTTFQQQQQEEGDSYCNRRQEWQQAFRSIYLNFREHVAQLQTTWKQQQQQQQDLEENKKESLLKRVTDTYFYVCCKGYHTILFRVGMQKQQPQQQNGSKSTFDLVPEIVISSSNIILRKQLRSRGVKLVLLERWDYDDFNEVLQGEWTQAKETKLFGNHSTSTTPQKTTKKKTSPTQNDDEDNDRETENASPNVQADLVALRRAQALGQTVGADVSVSIHTSSSNHHHYHALRMMLRRRAPTQAPPLVVTGIDDCAAFFEVYLNSCGHFCTQQQQQLQQQQQQDEKVGLPIILCRKLGPFLHSALKTVQIVKKGKPSNTTTSTIADGFASLELQGVLLPCAIRDIASATVKCLLADKKNHHDNPENRTTTTNNNNNKNNSPSSPGSHHLLLKTSLYDNNPTDGGMIMLQPIAMRVLGMHNSKLFNGGLNKTLLKRIQENKNNEDTTMTYYNYTTQSCYSNELLKMAVWNCSKPTGFAYKLEHTTTSTSTTLLG